MCIHSFGAFCYSMVASNLTIIYELQSVKTGLFNLDFHRIKEHLKTPKSLNLTCPFIILKHFEQIVILNQQTLLIKLLYYRVMYEAPFYYKIPIL